MAAKSESIHAVPPKDAEIVTASRPANNNHEAPSASHALADESVAATAEEKTAIQQPHQADEVKDLGWHAKTEDIPGPLVVRLPNDQLWTLIRRFNMQTFGVKSIDETPLANLDMNIGDDEEFSPDRLRAHLERLYTSVIVDVVGFYNHVARIRSWREYKRTTVFLAVYAGSWMLDCLLPTSLAVLTTLVVFPRARRVLFPPAPLALVDTETGGVKKPAAGVLATDDTITGAPEANQGEAVEEEAHSFVNSIASLVISTTAGKPSQEEEDSSAADPSQIIEGVSNPGANADRKSADGDEKPAEGDDTSSPENTTQEPISQIVWTKARPVMHQIADFTDTWERFSNALSATAPFPRRRPRLGLASCLVPMVVGSYFVSSFMMLKGLGFIFGFVFFGDPILTRTTALLNRVYPKWQKLLELRHSILRGIPTNAQVAITLLRVGERNQAPLPPPPASDEKPAAETNQEAVKDLDHLGVSQDELDEAVEPEASSVDNNEEEQEPKKEKGSKKRAFLRLLKGTAKGGVNTALTADRAKAALGSRHALERVGIVKSDRKREMGPVQFDARYEGQRGQAYLTTKATTPALSWAPALDSVEPTWTVLMADIAEIEKVGGLGWKTKIAVEWALDTEIVDGLIIKTRQGEEHHLTSVLARDQLFNRLISMGYHMWEMF